MKNTLLILKALALNYPILKSVGLVFPRLITIVVQPGDAANVANSLKNFKSVEDTNSDFVFRHANDRNTISKIINEYLSKLGEILISDGLYVLITENPVIDEHTTEQFFVFFDERVESFSLGLEVIVPPSNQINSIIEMIKEYKKQAETIEECCLMVASNMIQPYEWLDIDRTMLHEEVIKICARHDEVVNTNCVRDVFIKELYSWQEKNDFHEAYAVAEISTNICFDQNKIILYDDDSVYICNKLFLEIIKPLLKYVSIMVLKENLCKEGVLLTDRASGYTTKLSVNGNRIRVLKFNRDMLSADLALSFIDTCLM